MVYVQCLVNFVLLYSWKINFILRKSRTPLIIKLYVLKDKLSMQVKWARRSCFNELCLLCETSMIIVYVSFLFCPHLSNLCIVWKCTYIFWYFIRSNNISAYIVLQFMSHGSKSMKLTLHYGLEDTQKYDQLNARFTLSVIASRIFVSF